MKIKVVLVLNFCCFVANFHLISKSMPSGDYQFAARYYAPKTGQFTQPDTEIPGGAQNPISLNRCAYVFNKPFKYNDPDGHSPQDPSDDFETFRYIRDSLEAAKRYQNSNKGLIATLNYRSSSYKINMAYREYLGRDVVTGIIVGDQEGVPNAGQRVVDALQKIAGSQATFRAYEMMIGEKKAAQIIYKQNVDQLNNGSDSAKAWQHLKSSLNASRSLVKSFDSFIYMSLFPLESEIGRDLLDEEVAGVTIPQDGRRDLIILAMSDLDNYVKSIGGRQPLSQTLAHELKHAENIIKGKPYEHFKSPVEYIFNDDPIYPVDDIYRRAYIENTGEQVSPEPPSTAHLGGVGIRMSVFQNIFGVDPSKAKQKSR